MEGFAAFRRLSGIESAAEAWVAKPRRFLAAVGWSWVAALFLVLCSMFGWAVWKFPYFSPTALVEEAAHTYTSANNYLRFGFLRSDFLQDFSPSPDPADHPYVYNHMPAGPDVLTALLLKVSGGSYRSTRLFFALIFLVGIGFYFKFVRLVLSRLGLAGPAYAIMFLSPHLLLHNFDRQNSSPFPLLSFFPLVSLELYYERRKRRYLIAALACGLLSSVYLEYIALVAVASCWVLLYLTQLVRVDGRHLGAFLGVIALGILLHLVQNIVYLGPQLFWRELEIVVSNRMFGVPGKEELKSFYDSADLVHHGAAPFSVATFVDQVLRGLRFPAARKTVLTAIVMLGVALYDDASGAVTVRRGEGREIAWNLAKLVIWSYGTVSIPLFVFPAFAQEVNLYGNGATLYFLAIGGVAVVAYGVELMARWWSEVFSSDRGAGGRRPAEPGDFYKLIGLSFAIGACVALVVAAAGKSQLRELSSVVRAYQQYRYMDLGDLRRGFASEIYMTNISVVTVGFLTQSAGWGACDLNSLPDTGDVDPSRCHSSYVRRHGYYRTVRPKYFFFFDSPDLFPGFSDCLPSGYLPGQERGGDTCLRAMYSRLSERFKKVFQNRLFSVFDLDAPLSTAQPSSLRPVAFPRA